MSRHCGYFSYFTLMQKLLICRLHCGKLLPLGLLHLEGSQAQCKAPSLLYTVGAIGLPLQVVPPNLPLA
jgi:hypothetical protein